MGFGGSGSGSAGGGQGSLPEASCGQTVGFSIRSWLGVLEGCLPCWVQNWPSDWRRISWKAWKKTGEVKQGVRFYLICFCLLLETICCGQVLSVARVE